MNTLSYDKETKARKQHACNFCNERISIGEKYMNSTYIYDNRIYDWKTHKYCSKLADRLKMYDSVYDEGVTMDDFMEIVSDKHVDILTNQLPDKDVRKYNDIISQLTKVIFRHKLWFVIRHFNKLDKTLYNGNNKI